MAVITTQHTARKAHGCGLCDDEIRPGERYTMQVVSPGDPELDNSRWMRIRAHLGGDCYRYESTPPEGER